MLKYSFSDMDLTSTSLNALIFSGIEAGLDIVSDLSVSYQLKISYK
jgi:hypothetical protein